MNKELVLGLLLLMVIGSAAATYVNTCTTISSGGNYTLNASITNSATAKCFTISTNNVFLDCNGYTIDGNDAADVGIYAANRNNITIKDCVVTDWDSQGIFFNSGSNITIQNLTASSNPVQTLRITSINTLNITQTEISSTAVGAYLSNILNGNIEDSNIVGTIDIYPYTSSTTYCDTTYSNVNGSGGGYIIEYNAGASLSNWANLSAIILCNADQMNITNVSINGTTALYMLDTDNLIFQNSTIRSTYYPITLYNGDDNQFFNNIFNTSSSYFISDFWLVTEHINNTFNSSTTGNYWYNDAGTGISNAGNCVDTDGDALCDDYDYDMPTYTIRTEFNIDYLPLTDDYNPPWFVSPSKANNWNSSGNSSFMSYARVNWTGADDCRFEWNRTTNTTMEVINSTDFKYNKSIAGLASGNYTYRVWCNHSSTGEWGNSSSRIIKVWSAPADTNPAVLYNFNPPNTGSTSTTDATRLCSLNSNEPANCSYSLNSDQPIWNMTVMTTTDGTVHSQTVALIMGTNIIHFRCQDAAGNNNTLSQNVTVIRSSAGGGGGGGGVTITTPLNASITQLDNIIIAPIWTDWHYTLTSSQAVTCKCQKFTCSSIGYEVTISHKITADNHILYNITDKCTLTDAGGQGLILPVNLNVVNLAAYYPIKYNDSAIRSDYIFADDPAGKILGVYWASISVFFGGIVYAYKRYS